MYMTTYHAAHARHTAHAGKHDVGATTTTATATHKREASRHAASATTATARHLIICNGTSITESVRKRVREPKNLTIVATHAESSKRVAGAKKLCEDFARVVETHATPGEASCNAS
jgi:hypothetical protein